MNDQPASSPLDRLLRLFADVKPGEGLTALLLTLNVFLLLTSYYIIKPVREALILAGGGAELKAYLAAGQMLVMIGAVKVFAHLAESLPRKKLINSVTLFFTACLVVFYVLAQLELPLGAVFFVWVGVFNLMVIAQFWSFANDVYTKEEGERLFAIVAFGASSGAVFGSYITGRLIEALGTYQMLLMAGAVLATSLLLTAVVDARSRRQPPVAEAASEAPSSPAEEPEMGKEGAFRLVLQNRYLLSIALLVLLLNWVNTTGEYILSKTVARAAADAVSSGAAGGLNERDFIGKFYADFFAVVNLAGMLVQLFAVSRIIKYLGVRVGLLVLPVIAFCGYTILAFFPILVAVRWAKTAENATDYSLYNTVRQALFLPTTREQKYKAKQAIDTFFARAGDVLQAVLVFVGVNLLMFETQHFAMFNLALVAVWIALAVAVGRGYNRLSAGQEEDSASA
jgi:AAA family ATP:ADP antiporter